MADNSEKEATIFDEKSKAKYIAGNMRAVQESILLDHFGEEIMDDLFERYGKKAIEYMKNGKGIINNVVMSLSKQNKKEEGKSWSNGKVVIL